VISPRPPGWAEGAAWPQAGIFPPPDWPLHVPWPHEPAPSDWPDDTPWPEMTPPPEELEDSEMPHEPLAPEPEPALPPSRLTDVFEIPPDSLEAHPYSDLLPEMTRFEYEGLRESIAVDGQQVPAVIYEGKLLDGRNRARACGELGLPLRVQEYHGDAADAMSYVISVNQHRRELTKSQRAAVAANLVDFVTDEVNEARIAKIRQARKAYSEVEIYGSEDPENETGPLVSQSKIDPEMPRARDITASWMNVSPSYVQYARHVKTQDDDLFRDILNGGISVKAALAKLDGSADSARTRRIATIRRRLNRALGNLEKYPDFLERLEEFLDAHDV